MFFISLFQILEHEKSNRYYDSDSIKRDKSRIKFPEHIKFAKAQLPTKFCRLIAKKITFLF